MVPELIKFLRQIQTDLTAEEVADILWLAAHLDHHPPVTPPSAPAIPPPTTETAMEPASTTPRPVLPEVAHPRPTGPVASPAPTAVPPRANLYPAQTQETVAPEKRISVRPFRSPGAPALPNKLAIGRALRPLMRKVPSRTEVILDEQATAHHIADTGEWLPVLRPAPERWLDVAVVVDESPNMVIWQRTLLEFVHLLERQGAFRQVTRWGLHPETGATGVRLHAGFGPTADRSRGYHPSVLIDVFGRRLVLVISDCVSPMWHNGVMADPLVAWGQSGLLTLVQTLPQRLWPRTGLRNLPQVFLRATAPGTHNRALEIDWPRAIRRRLQSGPQNGAPAPIVTLEPESLGFWSRALAGHSGIWLPGYYVPPRQDRSWDGDRVESGADASRMQAEERVERFFAVASPMAQRLAAYLAAVPLTLPVMRLVQSILLADSQQVHLAEVFLGGLIDRSQTDETLPEARRIYDFFPGVRELLLNHVRIGETIDVLSAVSEFVGRRSGQPLDFEALIADPSVSGSLEIAADNLHFARIAAPVLRRFGGRYAQLAGRMEASIGIGPPTTTQPDGQVEPAARPDVDARVEERAPETGLALAMLVGIDNYLSSDAQIPALRGCVNDVRMVQELLVRDFGVPGADLHMLTDDMATRDAILGAWDELARQAQRGTSVFFHFSGHGAQERSDDVAEPDGFEETLVAYDSRAVEGSDIRSAELLAVATRLLEQGVHVTLFLDTVHAASSRFARFPHDNLTVIAACRENEQSYEFVAPDNGGHFGALTYMFQQALRVAQTDPSTAPTWATIFDRIVVDVKANYPQQNPQFMGNAHRALLSERDATRIPSPYLLVMEVDGSRLAVNAHAALGLRAGARLAIYPPGSDMREAPVTMASVVDVEQDRVWAEPESPAISMAPASRVAVQYYDDSWLDVAVDDDVPNIDTMFGRPVLSLRGSPPDSEFDLRVAVAGDYYQIEDAAGMVLMRVMVAPTASVEQSGRAISAVLYQLALYRRLLTLENSAAFSDLHDAISLHVEGAGSERDTRTAHGDTMYLLLHNHAKVPLFFSLWQLTARYGARQIYPAQTDCLLLASGKELRVPVRVEQSDPGRAEEPLTFKVFATRQPADLRVLTLPDLDESVQIEAPPLVSADRFVSPPAAAPAEGVLNGAGVRAKLWEPGRTLHVRFLDGEPSLWRRVEQVARLWLEDANLRLVFDNSEQAEIRISFREEGAWSQVGTDCLQTPADRPTMNFGWLDANTPEQELRRVVLHQFGHALGLDDEALNPNAEIPWDQEAVYAWLEGPPNFWSREQIERVLFHRYDPEELAVPKPFDPDSIMLNPIPNHVTTGDFEIGWNDRLSDLDRTIMARLYSTGTR